MVSGTSKVVLLFSDENDNVVKSINKSTRALGLPIDLFCVDKFKQYIHEAKWPVVLDAKYPQAVTDKFNGAYVVNRIFDMSHTQLMGVSTKACCNEAWIHVVLDMLLGNSRALVHDSGPQGVSRSLLPLNAQWWLIKESGLKVSCPNFAFGFGQDEPDTSFFRGPPLKRTPWSLFNWTLDKVDFAARDYDHPFYIDRPLGVPVLHWYLEDFHKTMFLKGRCDINDDHLSRIRAVAMRLFSSRIGEFLSFVDDGVVTFAAFSPFLESASRDPDFDGATQEWMVRAVSGRY